jgi:hypothetical protein
MSGVGGASAADRPVVQLCQGDGWKIVGAAHDQTFDSFASCVRYGARGGTYVPLLQAVADQRCILDPIVPPNNVCLTVTGFGLVPGSTVIVSETIEGETIVSWVTVDADGRMNWQTAAGCVPGSEEIVISIFASGVTATGVLITTPEQSFSIFCTRS